MKRVYSAFPRCVFSHWVQGEGTFLYKGFGRLPSFLQPLCITLHPPLTSLFTVHPAPNLDSWKVTWRDWLFGSCIKGTNYRNMQPTSILPIRALSEKSSTIFQCVLVSPSAYRLAIIPFPAGQQWLTLVLFPVPPSPSAVPQHVSSFPPTFPSVFQHINLKIEQDAAQCSDSQDSGFIRSVWFIVWPLLVQWLFTGSKGMKHFQRLNARARPVWKLNHDGWDFIFYIK